MGAIKFLWELNMPSARTRKLGIYAQVSYQQSNIVQRVECFCTDTFMKVVPGSQFVHEVTECYTINDKKMC